MGTVFLIIGIVIVSLIVLFFIIKFATKPKINYKKTKTLKANETKQNEKPMEIKSVEGLNFEEKFIVPEEPVRLMPNNFKNLQNSFPKNFTKKRTNKSLAEQINELSPELKALILDRGLARKDID